MIVVYDEHILDEENKIKEIRSMIEMKSEVKRAKIAFEKQYE